jgi:3'-phosphoadenosine 5'-phosphosulfate sulfotransferase (PAPS reductase)/FAD synthetase|tara:strand:- start:48 stop:749 length:702 start_codon:yes stop_codon:yes gene_type:complete
MKHIVGLSGGKDSTALALRLAEVEPRKYVYICNETGNELPDMKAHWDNLENILGEPIQRVRHARSLIEEIEKINMLPNVFARWCTIRLKIEPTIDYFESLPAGSTLYVGLRADEMDRKGLYGEDITVRFPMREWNWNEKDVWDYLNSKGICIPKRTDCALCPYQRLGEWRDLYENYPDLYAEGVALEKKIGHTFRSPGRDNWPANLELLSKEFDAGRKLREYKRKDTCRVCSL